MFLFEFTSVLGVAVASPAATAAAEDSVHFNTAMKTPQMYLLWMTLFGNTIAGITLISAAKTMMTDVFGASLSEGLCFGCSSSFCSGNAYPAIVTSAFAASFVMGLAAANMSGRLAWGPLSDRLGRKLT